MLAIVIAKGMATRSHIEDERGFSQSRVSPGGTMIPRDCSETLALVASRGLLAAERDEGAHGRPNVYRPTPQLLYRSPGVSPDRLYTQCTTRQWSAANGGGQNGFTA